MTRLRVVRAASHAPSLAELRDGPPTVDVPLACRALGISSSHGYALLRRGEFPAKALKVGSTHRVITADLVRVLSAESGETAA